MSELNEVTAKEKKITQGTKIHVTDIKLLMVVGGTVPATYIQTRIQPTH